MRLYHYSREADLSNIDPRFHGRGIRGAESRRKQHSDFLPRSYWYAQGEKREHGLGPHCYVAEVPESSLYDAHDDPLHLLELARDEARRLEWCCINCAFENLIHKRGYAGYRATMWDYAPCAVFLTLGAQKRSDVESFDHAAEELHK
jgi:hypothetical protein